MPWIDPDSGLEPQRRGERKESPGGSPVEEIRKRLSDPAVEDLQAALAYAARLAKTRRRSIPHPTVNGRQSTVDGRTAEPLRVLPSQDPYQKFPIMPAIKKRKNSIKARAMRLVRELPADSSWDDLMYRIYVRQKIEAGLVDLRRGRTHSHESIRREFGLST